MHAQATSKVPVSPLPEPDSSLIQLPPLRHGHAVMGCEDVVKVEVGDCDDVEIFDTDDDKGVVEEVVVAASVVVVAASKVDVDVDGVDDSVATVGKVVAVEVENDVVERRVVDVGGKIVVACINTSQI